MLNILKIAILSVFSLVLITSCSNDFELTAPKKEIPVVYALLDASDTAQYFRVERAFIDEDISAFVLAQRADSLYYNDAVVTITKLSSGESWTMDVVDGAAEGYPREDGAFANTPNQLYKIRTVDIDLEEEENFELRIDFADDQQPLTATTTMMKPPFLSTPQQGGNINLDPRRKLNIKWNDNATNAIFDVYLTFFYDETTLAGDITSHSLRWQLGRGISDNEIDVLGSEFYTLLASRLEANPNITRREKGASFTLVSGGVELSEYIRIGQANLGITSSGEIPLYEGSLSRGLGLFSSRNTEMRSDLQLTPISRDSLMNSVVTQDLNFQ